MISDIDVNSSQTMFYSMGLNDNTIIEWKRNDSFLCIKLFKSIFSFKIKIPINSMIQCFLNSKSRRKSRIN